MAEPTKKAFVERLFARHRNALQAFFYRRITTKADAPDLAQEVYVRMLRVSDPEAIRNPRGAPARRSSWPSRQRGGM
jgi:DNA-directed RNA polymerase specialized sigma24 family protein